MTTLSVLLLSAAATTGEISSKRNLAYGPAERQVLDLFSPESDRPAPVVLWIHGGAWKFGDKSHLQSKPAWLTGEGWGLVAMNYRFVPTVTWREQAADVAAAIAWLQTHGAEEGLDPTRIVLMGHSAGAHLAALVANDLQYLTNAKADPGAICGVVLVDGAGYDVPRQSKFARGWLGNVYEDVFSNSPAEQQAASPLTHVKPRGQWPEFLILHCADRIASREQAILLSTALLKSGAKATVYSAQGKTHMTINRELGAEEDLSTKEIERFLGDLRD